MFLRLNALVLLVDYITAYSVWKSSLSYDALPVKIMKFKSIFLLLYAFQQHIIHSIINIFNYA